MYVYPLTGWEERLIILNEKEFNDEEFETMCKEAPVFDGEWGKSYDSSLIIEYLVKEYGFIEPNYKAGFFIDTQIE